MPVFLYLVLHLPEWSPIVDSFLDSNPKYEVSSEMFDPSFFLCKISKNSKFEDHAKSVKSSGFRWRYLGCLSSKFRAKTTVWKQIFRITFFEGHFFSQRFWYGLRFEPYKQHILYLASRWYEPLDTKRRAAVKFTSSQSQVTAGALSVRHPIFLPHEAMGMIIIFNFCGSSVTFLVDSLTLGAEKSWYEHSLFPSGKVPVKKIRVKPEILNIYQVQKFR